MDRRRVWNSSRGIASDLGYPQRDFEASASHEESPVKPDSAQVQERVAAAKDRRVPSGALGPQNPPQPDVEAAQVPVAFQADSMRGIGHHPARPWRGVQVRNRPAGKDDAVRHTGAFCILPCGPDGSRISVGAQDGRQELFGAFLG